MKTISKPNDRKQKYFATMGEAARKDMKRAFGVLQPRSSIFRGATMMWESQTLCLLMTSCVILHNMIAEDEADGVAKTNDFETLGIQVEIPEYQDAMQLMNFSHMHQNLRDHHVHTRNYLKMWCTICGPIMEIKEHMIDRALQIKMM